MSAELSASNVAELSSSTHMSPTHPQGSEQASTSVMATYDSGSDSAGSTDDQSGPSPQMTSFGAGSDPFTASPGTEADPSMVAQHGSVLTRPRMMKGLKDSSKFRFPRARRTTPGKDDAKTQVDGPVQPVEEENGESVEEGVQQRTKRVVGIDFDGVCCQDVKAMSEMSHKLNGTGINADEMDRIYVAEQSGDNSPEGILAELQILSKILPGTLPVPGLADGLHKLHSLGHAVHVVTVRPTADRDAVVEWLSQQGTTVGSGEADVVASLNFVGPSDGSAGLNPEEPGESGAEGMDRSTSHKSTPPKVGRVKDRVAKMELLREVGAAFFIEAKYSDLKPGRVSHPRVSCSLIDPERIDSAESPNSLEPRLAPRETRSAMQAQDNEVDLPKKTWEDVVDWVQQFGVE